MPQTKNFTVRLPPHVHAELQRLKRGAPAHFREPSDGDMVGALLLAARRSPETFHRDLADYFEIRKDWERKGQARLPDL